MPRIERNRKIDNFVKIAFQRIRDTMRLLTSTLADTDSEEEKYQLDSQFKALSAYEDRVVSEFRTLQIEKSPPPDSVLRIYQSALEETKKAINHLKGDSKACELILTNFEEVTNFCTNVLTKENGMKFFDTKGLNVDEVKRVNGEIQESWETFTKESNIINSSQQIFNKTM
ncbi:TPA: hypothetical protein JAN90_06945 [Legionella pneumophila]|uniref:hypothetical protein n=1 Tax=Legionella sp. PATHC039 TaxID=2992042 RepID=UPI000778335A|nr:MULTISPECIES: hypothetical protein [Legionella]HAT8859567.1 hypothetical protein [Legionella pneumophila subsp. pneumophila]MCW8395710.1 hypothetical protein [Legionella sp. PATHC039]HAT7072512.1 hypothetical protein [Legionella pneumophila]HAT8642163.1 hypothetical protein [Legionella pneumophila]HAT8868591.1 hypothetical protein [Legionella pneumophila subsp. pneumophila]